MAAIVIHITVPANISDVFVERFLKIHPKPLLPEYTDEQWCKEMIKQHLNNIQKIGDIRIAVENEIEDMEFE